MRFEFISIIQFRPQLRFFRHMQIESKLTVHSICVCVCTCVEGPAEPSPVSHSTSLIPNSGFAFGFPQREVCIKCPQTCVPVPSCPSSIQFGVSNCAESQHRKQAKGEAFLIGVVVGDFIKMFALRFCLFVYVSICLFVCLFARLRFVS